MVRADRPLIGNGRTGIGLRAIHAMRRRRSIGGVQGNEEGLQQQRVERDHGNARAALPLPGSNPVHRSVLGGGSAKRQCGEAVAGPGNPAPSKPVARKAFHWRDPLAIRGSRRVRTASKIHAESSLRASVQERRAFERLC